MEGIAGTLRNTGLVLIWNADNYRNSLWTHGSWTSRRSQRSLRKINTVNQRKVKRQHEKGPTCKTAVPPSQDALPPLCSENAPPPFVSDHNRHGVVTLSQVVLPWEDRKLCTRAPTLSQKVISKCTTTNSLTLKFTWCQKWDHSACDASPDKQGRDGKNRESRRHYGQAAA